MFFFNKICACVGVNKLSDPQKLFTNHLKIRKASGFGE